MKGSREVTIYDVAKVMGVSPSTVSRALKDHPYIKKDTKKRIKALAAEMGYQRNKFASNLRQRHTNNIGVIVPNLNSFFMATALAGIEKVTSQNGYGLIISQSRESFNKELSCISTLYNSRVDGLLISLAFDTRNLDHFDILLKKEIPVVFFDRVVDHQGFLCVIIDNYKAAYEVTSHLLDQGCRSIVHIGGNQLRNVYSERLKGYRQALEDRGIKYDPSLVFITELTEADGIDTIRKILRLKSRPDGIFASNDNSAVGALIELRKRGVIVPDEIAVAGFNNEPISHIIKPELTTVDYPAMEIGEIAAKALIDKLQNANGVNLSTVILNHKLIVRESSLFGKTAGS